MTILLIIVLLILVAFLLYRLDLYKSYYKYYEGENGKLEAELKSERSINTTTLKKLNKIAYTNPMTDLGNYDYFIEKSQKLFADNPAAHFYLIAFDIHNLGKISNIFGPTEADNVISYAAEALRFIGQRDRHLVAQIYSNLFAFIVNSDSNERIVELITELTQKLQSYNDNMGIDSTFGVYEITDTSKSLKEMVQACMLAQKFVDDPEIMNYAFYSELLEETIAQNKQMCQQMEEALDNNDFIMHLQPMVDLKTFRIVGAEALVRWDYPGKGILSPYSFIPLLESTNLVQKLDYYMWEECLKTIRNWIDNKITPTPISMNISPVHLQSLEFIDYLDNLCEHYLIDKNLLILELPERGLSASNMLISEIIINLKSRGFILCIDNFGSINSPLNILRDYSIDQIKIDRSCLTHGSNSEEGLTILRYLIAMAKEMGLTVITEGVETLEQTNLLGEIGSDYAQGYFFSKPVDLRTFNSISKSMVQHVYQSNQYYPTFEDLQKDLDLIAFMIDE